MPKYDDELSIEELLRHAACLRDNDLINEASRYIGIANSKMGMENIKLTKRTQELTEEQIKVSSRANELTEKLLLSNEQASKDSKANADLMYKATEQLAISTISLNRATWVLVAFTAVQALIAFASLYVSMHQGK